MTSSKYLIYCVIALILGVGGILLKRGTQDRSDDNVQADGSGSLPTGSSLPQSVKISDFKSFLERGEPATKSLVLLSDVAGDRAKAKFLLKEIGEESTVRFLSELGGELHANESSALLYGVLMESLVDSDPSRALIEIKKIGPANCDQVTFSELVAIGLSGNHEEILDRMDAELFGYDSWHHRIDANHVMTGSLAKGRASSDVLHLLASIPDGRKLADTVALNYFSDAKNRADVLISERQSIREFVSESDGILKSEVLAGMDREWE